jgi:formamidopyrimidine-DNA glycosylase
MKHRWNKGKKDANVLPNGEKIIHLKVGGRTSAVVPSVQKKTGPVAGDVISQDTEDDSDEEQQPKKKAKKGKKEAVTNGIKKELGAVDEPKPSNKRKSAATNGVKEEQKISKKAKAWNLESTPDTGRRRSGRHA